jgi:hypothetical protein
MLTPCSDPARLKMSAVWVAPPGCPKLNRIQRVWRGLRDEGAWQQFADLAAHLDAVSHLLQACDAPALQALTG